RRGLQVRQRLQVGGDKLDVRCDAHRAEQPAADGAEEGLGELRVRQFRDPCGERAMDLPPQVAIQCLRPEPEANLRDRLVYEAVVESDALDGVLLAAAPVACVEA